MNDKEHVTYYYSDAVGWLELRVSDKGVRSISYVSAPASPRSTSKSSIMAKLVAELDHYFKGKPVKFSVPLDPPRGTSFERKVWDQLTAIPYGQTRSYSQIAAAIDKPRAARAVGNANGKNSIPILIPCHRVVKADGGLGGYSSGIPIKKALLELEGVRF